ncbi:MAG: glycosyl hydrolase family 18 protein, partial [Vicinamibacterales bacterium]
DTVVNDQASEQDIFIARIADLTPAAPLPPPDVTIPELVYYPETGHYLDRQFRTFWESNGGLPVFGYPLTKEYEERNRDSGDHHPVQFFERQRFELHPENAGTPYEVLLGRLGYEDAVRRGLLDSAPFQPARQTGEGDCVWFAETSQAACDEFSAYWRAHGLELGDEGTSHRKSLALFGYPISAPFVDPDTGLLTQYFERAVFELHPNNPDPYRVLLRRLGAEVLVERGWRIE